MNDGIHGMLPREQMCEGAKTYWDFYNMVPNAPFYKTNMGYYSLDRWYEQDGLSRDANLHELFGNSPQGRVDLMGLGWTEAGFAPEFDDVVLEDRGDYELVQDNAGRSVLFFKGRRNGFMPEYVDHPVKDMKSWEEKCRWRMDPNSPSRQADMDRYMPHVVECAKKGMFVGQMVIGGYMYLRSLMGPEGVLYMFYDDPKLIHACMEQWLYLADNIIARHQQHVTIDELFIGEDICYKNGPLISPDMIREFLLPYYQQLLTNMRRRQIDKTRRLGFQLDTDGFCDPVIDIYKELGMTMISPFEVASNSDVIRTGMKYPDLRLKGGVDKRVLAMGPKAIDEMVDRIFPVMKKRGGYIPTCDHGVPEEVSLENYLHYRKRLQEFG